MHLNFFFLSKLVPAILERIMGKALLAAFSQDKDELVLEFGNLNSGEATVIRAFLRSDFTCLYFPASFERAKSNSADLFRELVGKSVVSGFVYKNERAFALEFSDHSKMVFKLFGNRSNLLHFNPDGNLINLFNRRLAKDQTLEEASLHRVIDQTFEHFKELKGDYKLLFPTFGKTVNQYLQDRLAFNPSLEEKWQIIQSVLTELRQNGFYLIRRNSQIELSLLPVGEVIQTFTDPIDAVNSYCLQVLKTGNIEREKELALKRMQKLIHQTENYIKAGNQKLAEIPETGTNELFANLIMANLHRISEGMDKITLENFYTGNLVDIPLKTNLSPSKNAESYFRKAKNEKLELSRLNENINARMFALADLRKHLGEIEKAENVRDLRAYLKQHDLHTDNRHTVNNTDERFRQESYMGYQIFIGKNARNNEELTLKFAKKDDLWLHARDVTGSHVVIRAIPGRTIPAAVIERAAELAAWYSKRRNDSLCPVSVTPKKFVRKRKGLPVGSVILERESVVMVVPKG